MRSKWLVAVVAAVAVLCAVTFVAAAGTWRKNTWHLTKRGAFSAYFRIVPNGTEQPKTFFLEISPTSNATLSSCKLHLAVTTIPAQSVDSENGVFHVTFGWPIGPSAKATATCKVGNKGGVARVIAVFGQTDIKLKRR